MPPIFSVLILIAIFILTYVVTRFLGVHLNARLKSQYMEVVDSLMMDKDTKMMIVKIQGKYYVSTLSRSGSSSLTHLHDFHEDEKTNPVEPLSFQSILKFHRKEKNHEGE